MGHPERARVRVAVRGAVQGVGFRPFIFRLATALQLDGWVNNSPQGVCLEVEGAPAALDQFLARLRTDRPPRSSIQSLETTHLDPTNCTGFEIRASQLDGDRVALVLPDIATCDDCRREIFDPANRRFRYPFTNCTHCGPRFSIIEALPYDRRRTSMRRFTMCDACRAEYDDPRDRRFHAQPNACPVCGPHLEWWDPRGRALDREEAALMAAGRELRAGAIVAVKGLGGFHLMVRADDTAAVERLRQVKHREEKPFALMLPSLAATRACCEVSAAEERLLTSPESPIVLLKRRANPGISPAVAPNNPWLGVMLPYTPLHELLLAEFGSAVVATSGNLSDEPICTDELEAVQRLAGLADFFLVHDRPIVRPVDDSIARVLLGREQVLRRARGYAPLPVPLPHDVPCTLAVGAHLKNSIALAIDRQVFLSQHLGDLDTAPALAAFERAAADLPALFAARPQRVVADLHPDYRSTAHARATGLPVQFVQHHFAHVAGCMAENGLQPPVLGVAWDGTGYGTDGTIWGGEFLLATGTGFERVAHLRPFRLPGGETAVREPRRAALGLLWEMLGPAAFARVELPTLQAFDSAELALLRQSLERAVNAPWTTSAGRLFDVVASLAGLRQRLRFEGQAAMELEFALDSTPDAAGYEIPLREGKSPVLADWQPLIERVIADATASVAAGVIAARFHFALAQLIVAVARRVGCPRVALSGGCFQNRTLTEWAVRQLHAAGFSPYWHQRVPPNDGGIALGQIAASARARQPTN